MYKEFQNIEQLNNEIEKYENTLVVLDEQDYQVFYCLDTEEYIYVRYDELTIQSIEKMAQLTWKTYYEPIDNLYDIYPHCLVCGEGVYYGEDELDYYWFQEIENENN